MKVSIYSEVNEFIESTSCSLLTTKEDFINKSETIEIKCGQCDHGIIKTRFNDFIDKKYKMCKECASFQKRKEFFDEFKRFVEIESECILLSTVDDYVNNRSKLKLVCPCGNEFYTTNAMFAHSGKRQCNECGSKRKGQDRKIPYEEVKKYLNEFNCKLITTTKDYENAGQKLDIQCSCGNVFQNSFSLFKYGKTRRCNECYRKESSERSTIPYSEIKRFVEIDSKSGCKLLTTEDEYLNTHTEVNLLCECGNPFKTTIHGFKSDNKQQCNACGNGSMKTSDFVDMFKDSNLVNGCKLLGFEDSEGIIHVRSIIKVECACGDVFETKRNHFTYHNKKRCDRCSSKMSKGEDEIRKFLINHSIKHIREYTFNDCRGKRNPLPFDFAIFDKQNNIIYIIEYDGKQHFEPVNFGGCSDEISLEEHLNLKKNDSIKNEYCKSNNIPLLRIPYWEFDRIEEILSNNLFKIN